MINKSFGKMKILANVSKSIPLTNKDYEYSFLLYLIQLLNSNFGYREYVESRYKDNEILKFAYFRTRLCEQLFKKIKKEVEI